MVHLVNQARNATNNTHRVTLGPPHLGAVAGFYLLFSLTVVPIAQANDAITCQVRSALASDGSIVQQLRNALQQAHSEVLVALYGFNNPILAHELVSLAKRGVRLRVKIDAEKTTKRKTRALIDLLRSAGISVEAVAADGRNHNKFVVVDGKQVITGSYNWTSRAEENWENLLFLDCPELAKRYAGEWRKLE